MSTSYPGTIQSFVNPVGTNTLDDPDHAGLHSDVADTIEAIEAVIGTTAGTSVLKDFSAGEFAVRQEGGTVSPGTLTFDSPVINGEITGTAILDEDDMSSNSATQLATQQSIKAYVDLRNNAPEGFLINGKIVPSVASNNLTVAIKGLDGNDPSAANPVYIMLGGVLRSITSALSVTKNAGTNYFGSGSSALATKEVDYFVYLGYNATDGVVIGFSRIPYVNLYSDFSTTSTDSRYAAISTITNAVAGDSYTVIGRFAATLSAGAGYTWSVPTFTKDNLIQRPIYETRWLYAVPIVSLAGAGTAPVFTVNITKYKILNDYCHVFIELDGDGGADGAGAVELKISSPISMAYTSNPVSLFVGGYYGSASANFVQFLYLGDASNFNLRISITGPLNADQFGAGPRYLTGSGSFSLR